jgi:hypothetical protein
MGEEGLMGRGGGGGGAANKARQAKPGAEENPGTEGAKHHAQTENKVQWELALHGGDYGGFPSMCQRKF